jgi:hypothetical protein
MLVDAYAEGWLEELAARDEAVRPDRHLTLLIDSAFVPNIHDAIPREKKALLFERLPGCSDEARKVSPVLVSFDATDGQLEKSLMRCDRWPMVSAIETTEPLVELAARLAAWCVVEADNQRFNFRFADTRRLPAVLSVLNAEQLAQFCGRAASWLFIGRDGAWYEKELVPLNAAVANDPVLDQSQFSALVEDSRADELLNSFSLRGHTVYRCPSRSYELLSTALGVADEASLNDGDLSDWCEWFWQQDARQDHKMAGLTLQAWLAHSRR